MNAKGIAEKIIDLKNADLALREQLVQNGQLGDGYNPAMQQLHQRNAERLNDIIDTIGYPTIGKVGREASEAAWLVIQHAIGQPAFMKKCVALLTAAVRENEADAKQLAYLTDRIAVLEARPQLYGTQFDWDENGELSPEPYDDLAKVNQRRKLSDSIPWRRRPKLSDRERLKNTKKHRQTWIKESRKWKHGKGRQVGCKRRCCPSPNRG